MVNNKYIEKIRLSNPKHPDKSSTKITELKEYIVKGKQGKSPPWLPD